MSEEQNQSEEPKNSEKPTSRSGEIWLWFLLGIAPIPIGLMIGSDHLFDSFQSGGRRASFMSFAIFTVLLSVTAGIGEAGGFKTKRLKAIAIGVFGGIWIAGFDLFVVVFAGCCSAFSHIH
ncbi:MAG: hypothetical protein HOP33_13435 [Verrucomicrobia bacterium]|nr:hypothetical protein [Verrucomicrobiota bacterium]